MSGYVLREIVQISFDFKYPLLQKITSNAAAQHSWSKIFYYNTTKSNPLLSIANQTQVGGSISMVLTYALKFLLHTHRNCFLVCQKLTPTCPSHHKM